MSDAETIMEFMDTCIDDARTFLYVMQGLYKLKGIDDIPQLERRERNLAKMIGQRAKFEELHHRSSLNETGRGK